MRRTALALALLGLGLATGAVAAPRTDVILGVRLEPPNLDPTSGAAAATDEVVYANVFEGLTRIDRNGAVQPALARSWEVSDDGLVYTFRLAENVKFHDGTSFDAEDVKFSLERAKAPDSTNAQKGLFEPISSVEVVDPQTVRVTLSKPTGDFLFNMGWGDAVIVAPETAANNATQPVGTGPFRFSRWAKGDSVELVRNPDYWGEQPKLEKATFKVIADDSAAMAALLAGDVDGFPIYPAPENLDQFKADPRFAVVVGTTEGETILSLNNAKEPFDDVRVRRALAHAIDPKAVIDGAMFGYGTPIGSHFAPHHPSYVDLSGTYPHDPEKARALLKEAGLEGGFTTTLKLPPPSYARRGGEIIAAQLAEIGVKAEIQNLEWAQWLEEVFKGKNFDMTIVSHTEPMDIGIYARPDYYFQYRNPDFDAIMADLAAATEPTKRDELMKAAQRKLAEDVPVVFLFQLAKTGVWNAKLWGLWENAPIQANDLTQVYWEE